MNDIINDQYSGKSRNFLNVPGITRFNRNFFDQEHTFTYIGDGEIGGKASGLAFIKDSVVSYFNHHPIDPIEVYVPRLTVITTEFFDLFMKNNHLYDIALSDAGDDRIAYHFLKAELPVLLTGDLWGLAEKMHTPLAVRSSSLLEDRADSPFAGIYDTKMIPNNQTDPQSRFQRLTEAIKFVYASTFFSKAKDYIRATPYRIEDEKMAVIIQEVVGQTYNNRYYPTLSGVARSFNFYPPACAKPDDGVVNLALGLGKSIVEGSSVWSYSPPYPEINPPYASIKDLLKQTQTNFWAVNMGKPPAYDPMNETEYLSHLPLREAEYDDTISFIASTYDYEGDRINLGTASPGPRLINFGPILQANVLPLNSLVQSLLKICEDAYGTKVEIEFAVTISTKPKKAARFGLLQVRSLALSNEIVDLDTHNLNRETVFAVSENVMGNGSVTDICDVVYVVPETFSLKYSPKIAAEVAEVNRQLLDEKRPYLLIGFGRWGTSDPWLGIAVSWGEISGAKVIIEAQLPGINVDLSQGSHFFHNISNLGVFYFSFKKEETFPIHWEWLKQQEVIHRGEYVTHARLKRPLTIKVDGRIHGGMILK